MTNTEKIKRLQTLCHDEVGKLMGLLDQIRACSSNMTGMSQSVWSAANQRFQGQTIDLPAYQDADATHLRELVKEYNVRLLWFNAINKILG